MMFFYKWGPRTTFVILAKVDPMFFSPSGILMKQYIPKGVVKLVFSSSSLLIQIWWYPKKNLGVKNVCSPPPYQRWFLSLVVGMNLSCKPCLGM